jgi:hypothetical protein
MVDAFEKIEKKFRSIGHVETSLKQLSEAQKTVPETEKLD